MSNGQRIALMAKDKKLPAIHLYPGDWLRDSVSGCSLAAQGLWLRMMYLAHDSERYGYLEVNGAPMQPDFIARRCGCDDPAQYATLLSELFAAGVPSMSEKESIYSRRMVKDASLRAVKAKSGRKGGKQNGSKHRSEHEPPPEDEIEDEIETSQAFEEFWKVFPPGRKKSKGTAREAFFKAVKKTTAAEIIAAAEQYAGSQVGKGEFVKMPSSWLNQECWNDDREAWWNRDAAGAPVAKEYKIIQPAEFKKLRDEEQFLTGPWKDDKNPLRWFGQLKSLSKVECFVEKK